MSSTSTRGATATETPLEIRYPVEIRWARERGWLQIRDAFTGEWLEILAHQAPPWWRRQAQIEKLRRIEGHRRS